MRRAEQAGPPRQAPQPGIRSVPGIRPVGGGRPDADQAVTVLYDTHYRALTQLAALLVSDVALAEEIVQDAFVAIHRAWQHLGDTGRALPYLLRAVVRQSRSGRVARCGPPECSAAAPAAKVQAFAQLEPGTVTALRALPARQREALVLRYYADLPEAQIAAAMGVRARAARLYMARGMSSLTAILDRDHPAAPQSASGASPS
jgi:DNA-directed RNA polymerase specialized sigma24 family protein